jgi:hypothetical protein
MTRDTAPADTATCDAVLRLGPGIPCQLEAEHAGAHVYLSPGTRISWAQGFDAELRLQVDAPGPE